MFQDQYVFCETILTQGEAGIKQSQLQPQQLPKMTNRDIQGC